MSSPLAVYAEALRRETAGDRPRAAARHRDGSTRPLALARWCAAADAIDERALAPLRGPVLDVGCGPGRHLHALARRGVFGLGVDLSPVAVGLARGAGALAIVGSVFDELPGTGRWQSALLLDGNIGIGGRPARLLARINRLLARGGRTLVELDAPHTVTTETLIRLETAGIASDWFPWAEVSAGDIGAIAAQAGFSTEDRWSEDGRWFALLRAG
jgi:SAM-dependent methyltransferase